MTDARETLRRHEILLIGANGFLGKVLLGLLLDRFPDFKHLHILMRGKRKFSAADRFAQEVLASPPLATVLARPEAASAQARITIHTGELGEPVCGLEEETLEELSGRIGLVINCAGLVDFFPPVDEAFLSNVDGVERVVELAKRLGARLLHVSTCFVCGEAEGLIEESDPIVGFYPRRRGPRDQGFRHDHEIRYMRERIREAYESAGISRGERRPRELSQKLIDLGRQRAAQWGWVNTYTYTKSLGEQLIASAKDLEYTIVRPAIVEAALSFPFPGWVEGGRTAAPLVMMAMSGLRHWTVREDAPMEVIPVDLVATAILIAAVMLLNGQAERVYQVATADVNPVHFGFLIRLLHREYRRQRRHRLNGSGLPLPGLPTRVRVLQPEQARARGERQQKTLSQLQQWAAGLRRAAERSGVPGAGHLRRLASALRAASLQAMIRNQALELYQPFMRDNRFVFEAENMRAAYRRLSEADRERLPWTPEKINWRDYWIHNEVAGVQKWVWGETASRR